MRDRDCNKWKMQKRDELRTQTKRKSKKRKSRITKQQQSNNNISQHQQAIKAPTETSQFHFHLVQTESTSGWGRLDLVTSRCDTFGIRFLTLDVAQILLQFRYLFFS